MDIYEYFSKLNEESQIIFKQTINDKKENLGKLHHFSSCIYEFAECIIDEKEKNILIAVSTQLESATLNSTLGLYRQAFTSLRLAFEMGLATIYFSINKLNLYEWLDSRSDINWSNLINEEEGVLSKRFSNAFFPECTDYIEEYRANAILTYRKLSEYVHGNSETWEHSGLKLKYNNDLFDSYIHYYQNVSQIILFIAICRYAKSFDKSVLESLQFIPEEFSHITTIRELIGRS